MDRDLLWLVLSKQGVPPKMLAALRNLHQGMDSYVQYINESSGRFLIHTSVQQGSVEGPVLFILYLAPLTDIALPHNSAYRRVLGVELLAVDGDITDTKRIKNPKSYRVLDCSYADDTALVPCKGTFIRLHRQVAVSH